MFSPMFGSSQLVMALAQAIHLTLERPTMLGLISVLIPFWVAFLAGIAIGWLWQPKKWGRHRRTHRKSKNPDASPSSPSALRSPVSPLKGFGSAPCLNSFDQHGPSSESRGHGGGEIKPPTRRSGDFGGSDSNGKPTLLTEEDLKKLCELVEMKDGGLAWKHMLDRSSPTMSYQAWRRDPANGPPEYRTRTVFEEATPEIVRDFFWDDDFRPRWDDMLVYSSTIEECPTTGNTVVHWIRKFPFFCNDREYIIGRRIWQSGRSYYCMTKGVSAPIPRQDKPKRVDLYFSSWFIRPVESRKNDGQLSACEVLLFHYEDMGIPYEIAKLGVRHGMWGAVKKIEPGLRAYQRARLLGEPISRPAYMARINTRVNSESMHDLGVAPDSAQNRETAIASKPSGGNFSKVLLFGGAIALVYSLNHGLLSKAMIIGAANRLGDMRKKMRRSDAHQDLALRVR